MRVIYNTTVQIKQWKIPSMKVFEHLHKVNFNDFPKLLINSAGKTSGLGALLCTISKIASQISFPIKVEVRNSFAYCATSGILPILELSRAHKDSSRGC